MQWTNKFNLPLPITSAIKNFQDAYDKVGDISVSGLVKAPRMRQLELRHDDEITVDYSEFLWILLGQAMHKVLETADTTNHLTEERLTIKRHGWTISGKPDLFTPEEAIEDYKCTSVYSFLLGDKIEWERQLNLYDVLYRAAGFTAKKLKVNALLRDHMKRRAEREPDYPQSGFFVKCLNKWDPQVQENYLTARVFDHQIAESLANDALPLCTPEERWHKPDTWAVKKKGNKRALPGGIHSTPEGAMVFALEKDSTLKTVEIDSRPGVDTRCVSYCRVAQWCSQWKAIQAIQPQMSEEDGQ